MQGCVKVQFERPFFLGSVLEIIKTLNWKNILSTLIAVTRIINLDRCILQSNVLSFQYSYFISDAHYRVGSSQSERNFFLGGGERVLENEQGPARGERRSKLRNFERTYFLNVPLNIFLFLSLF